MNINWIEYVNNDPDKVTSEEGTRTALQEREEELFQMKTQNRNMMDQINNYELELKKLKRENFNLNSDMKIFQKRLEEIPDKEALLKELREKDHQIKIMNEEILENEALLQRFENELDKKRTKIEKLEYRIDAKTEEIHQLKYKLNEYQKRFEKVTIYESKIQLLIKENEELKHLVQMSASRIDNSAINTNGDDFEGRIIILENQIEDLSELVKRLKKELREMKVKCDEALKNCKYWEKKRDELAEQVNDLEVTIDEKIEENGRKAMSISLQRVKIFVLMAGLKHSAQNSKK